MTASSTDRRRGSQPVDMRLRIREAREGLRNWTEDYLFVTPRRARERARNAFELGYDAGEARLRERIGGGAS